MYNKIITSCPLTGTKIITSSDWQNIECGKEYSASFKIIENNIIHGEGIGKGSIEGFIVSLGLAYKIIKENFNNKPFVYIENFKNVINPSAGARKFYTNFMKNLKNMEALIYYNVGAYLKFNIKLAKKLNFFHYPVFIVNDYEEAVLLAMNILKTGKEFVHYKTKNIIVFKKPEWSLRFNDFNVSFEINNGDIFHIKAAGIIKKEYLKSISALRNKILKEYFSDKKGNYYYLSDLANIEVQKDARKPIMKEYNNIYKNYPFKFNVIYNANNITNVLFLLSHRFIKYPLKKTKDFKSAIAFIERDKNNKNRKKFTPLIGKKTKETDKDLEQFVKFLGQIDWEKEGIDESFFIKDEFHPFYQAYEAIAIIKTELDNLYREKKKKEEEKAILEYKLRQSLKLEAVGKLAGTVAHDLNNVLMGIVSYPDFVIKLLKQGEEPEKILKYMKKMKDAGLRAASIVQDLLTISGKTIKNKTILNINKIIEEFLNSPEFSRLKNNNVEIIFNSEKQLYNIFGSKIHLYKTIMNLVKNSFEAIKDKGEIEIITKNRYFKNKKIRGYDKPLKGKFIELIIKDTGIGIEKKDLQKIFEPFYSKKSYGKTGTGLGMFIVKQTADDHSGAIEIISKRGKGSEFRLYFPAENRTQSEEIIKRIDNYSGKGELILIVDDEEEQRLIARDILKYLHYEVAAVSNGEDAVKYIKNNNVELVLLDMIMAPGIGGLETYKQIIKIKPYQKTIIVSGYSETEQIEEVRKLGVGKFIRKPYTIETIGKAVYEELNK